MRPKQHLFWSLIVVLITMEDWIKYLFWRSYRSSKRLKCKFCVRWNTVDIVITCRRSFELMSGSNWSLSSARERKVLRKSLNWSQLFVLRSFFLSSFRYNQTNSILPNFKLNLTQNFVKGLQNHSLNDIFRVYVFASNQKGRSQGIFITEFSFGNYDIQLNDSMTQSKHSSPVLVGLSFILFVVIGMTIVLRRYRRSAARKRRRRELEKEDKYNQESRCSLLKQDTFAVSVKIFQFACSYSIKIY